jgi:hypothetical protein
MGAAGVAHIAEHHSLEGWGEALVRLIAPGEERADNP